MSEHRATIKWKRGTETFDYPSYNRNHSWHFEGGIEVPASAAIQFLGTPERVDPEEAYVAAISSCHMLTFLAICARGRITVDSYRDEAVGHMRENDSGKLVIAHVRLSPKIGFGQAPPAGERIGKLHHLAHSECFIANSVNTVITVEGYSPFS